MCTYCGSGFFLLMCVQLYKQNRYRDTEIKGYVKGVKRSSIYTYSMLYMSEVSKVHTGLSIQSYVTYVEGVKSSSIYTIRAVMLCMLKVSKVAIKCYVCQSMSKHVKGVKGQNNL